MQCFFKNCKQLYTDKSKVTDLFYSSSCLYLKVTVNAKILQFTNILGESKTSSTYSSSLSVSWAIGRVPLRLLHLWRCCTVQNQISDLGSHVETQHTTTPVWISDLFITAADKRALASISRPANFLPFPYQRFRNAQENIWWESWNVSHN